MKTLWASLIEKHGSWWAGAIIGDIKYSFVCHPDYSHLPKYDRCQAAGEAVTASFRSRWFWVALVSMIGLVVGLCLVDQFFRLSDGNGTFGAVLGFIVGGLILTRAIYEGGIETYKTGLARKIKEAEQAVAPNRSLQHSQKSTSVVRGPED